MSTPNTALTVQQRAVVALGYNEETRKTLTALAGESAHIVKITNTAGRDQAHGAMMKLKTTRVEIEKRGKSAREDAQAFSKAVIAEEKALIDIVGKEEERLKVLRDGWDAAIEAERQAKIRAEEQRQEKNRQGIRDFETVVNGALRATTSADAARFLKTVEDVDCVAGFDEDFRAQAEAAKQHAVTELRGIVERITAREAEAARLKTEREEFDRQQAAQRAKDEREAALKEDLRHLNGPDFLTASSGSKVIAEHLEDLTKFEVAEALFAEFYEVAIATKAAGIKRLNELLTAATQHEDEQARIAEERRRIDAEAARVREEAAALDKRQREEREAAEANARAEQEQREKDERAAQAAAAETAKPAHVRDFEPDLDDIVEAVAEYYTVQDSVALGWILNAVKAAQDKKAA